MITFEVAGSTSITSSFGAIPLPNSVLTPRRSLEDFKPKDGAYKLRNAHIWISSTSYPWQPCWPYSSSRSCESLMCSETGTSKNQERIMIIPWVHWPFPLLYPKLCNTTRRTSPKRQKAREPMGRIEGYNQLYEEIPSPLTQEN